MPHAKVAPGRVLDEGHLDRGRRIGGGWILGFRRNAKRTQVGASGSVVRDERDDVSRRPRGVTDVERG